MPAARRVMPEKEEQAFIVLSGEGKGRREGGKGGGSEWMERREEGEEKGRRGDGEGGDSKRMERRKEGEE